MIAINLFISCASDVDDLRDVAADVMERLTQMFTSQTPWEVYIYHWDYRRDPGGPIPATEFAARSLEEVRKAEAMIAIFGERIGDVSRREVRLAFELRKTRGNYHVWPFVDPAKKGDDHRRLMRGIANSYSPYRLVYGPYTDPLDFQAKLMTALVPYVLRRVGVAVAPRITSAP